MVVERPDTPDFVGTIKKVFEHINTDPFLRSLKSGGTFYSTAFFVDGKRINTNSETWQFQLDDLLVGRIDELEVPLDE